MLGVAPRLASFRSAVLLTTRTATVPSVRYPVRSLTTMASSGGYLAPVASSCSVTHPARSLSAVNVANAVNAAAPSPPSYHVLQYKYVPDILDRRDPFRAEHLQGAKDMAAQRKIVMAGALTDPVDGAVFVFRDVTKEEIEAFVRVELDDLFSVVCSHARRSTLDARRSLALLCALLVPRFGRIRMFVLSSTDAAIKLEARCPLTHSLTRRRSFAPGCQRPRARVCDQALHGGRGFPRLSQLNTSSYVTALYPSSFSSSRGAGFAGAAASWRRRRHCRRVGSSPFHSPSPSLSLSLSLSLPPSLSLSL